MMPRTTPPHERFSNRQAAVFVAAVIIGLIGGGLANSVVGGMMLGAIAGAGAILLPGVRDRPSDTPADDPDPPSDLS